MKLNVLLIGSGGREHAMAWAISRSDMLGKLYIAPGNPGTAQAGENVDLDTSDFNAVEAFLDAHNVDLTVVGPEQPLVDGIADFLEPRGHKVFGPGSAAARLEGSKSFAKAFMKKNKIPTADYASFTQDEFDEAAAYVRERKQYPVVLKADGLAGGKGVFICENEDEVDKRLELLHEDAKLSQAARTLVVEEFMQGEEASVFVITDGKSAKIIHHAQDHKRIGEGDTGLNTGGMGAYCPAPVVTEKVLRQVEKEIILPTITGMIKEESPYKGILYLGLMINESGARVVEYNCRFGDPECQAVLPALQSDLLELMWAVAEEKLDEKEIEVDDLYHCCVVLASDGYPQAYDKGFEITGVDEVEAPAYVFQAGTAQQDGKLVTAGGRVLSVVSEGRTLQDAIDSTYRQLEKVSFSNAYYRSDIGAKGLRHLK